MAKKQIAETPELRPKTPVTGWRTLKIDKPHVTFNREAVRQAALEESRRPPTFWSLMVRFLPIWLLLIGVIIIDPLLPIHLIGGVFGWLQDLRRNQTVVVIGNEPIYIVEGIEAPIESELPPPDWPLEIAPFFTEEVQFWEEAIGTWSVTYRIRPNIIATIMQIESCGSPDAVSPAGATGLFQVMPFHFAEGEDAFDPNFNAMRGLLYYGELLALTNSDVALAFAAYNGGPSVIEADPLNWPEETQSYQYWASGIYEEAERGLSQSPTLIEWLNAGGVSLCDQAAIALQINQ